MAAKDPRIDAYIAKARPFAQPILRHLRAVVHEACPEVEETMKWSFPHFDYQGGMMCSMAAFSAHCAFRFWHAKALLGAQGKAGAMGDFGRITAVADLPSRTRLKALVKAAMRLNVEGVKRTPAPRRAARPPLAVPADLARALARAPEARATFDGFAPSHRREYIEWIIDAKTAATRERRLATTLEWLAEGKPRNWKYAAKGRSA